MLIGRFKEECAEEEGDIGKKGSLKTITRLFK